MQLTATIFNAGLGDLSLGLSMSGFKIVAAYEPDHKACAVHQMNLDTPIQAISLDKIMADSVPAADLLAAHLHVRPLGTRNSVFQYNDPSLESFLKIFKHCKPRAVFLLLNTSFLKSSSLPSFLAQMAGENYQFTWKVLDVSQATGFPVKESMACLIGLHQTIKNSFKFPQESQGSNFSPDHFLQLNQPVDPWYYQITLYDNPYRLSGNSPFFCWKRNAYQNVEKIQWNFMKIPLIRDPHGVRRITHREVALLKGIPTDFILPDSNRQWLYQKLIYSGNVLIIKQIAGTLNYLLAENPWRSQQFDEAIRFEKLFGRYLSNLAKKNDDLVVDKNFYIQTDSNPSKHGADFVVHYANDVLYFHIKKHQNSSALKSNINKFCIDIALLTTDGTPILVLANEVFPTQKEQCLKKYGVHIWDIANLLWLFAYFPDIKTEFIASLDFSIDHIQPVAPIPAFMQNVLEQKSEKPDWKKELLRIIPGNDQFSQYEHVCTEILKYVLGDCLTLWATQEKSNGGLYRFDLCCKIKNDAKQDFFDTIRHYFNTKYIVFEFKNYTDKITQKEIYTTEKYLYEKALRKVAIIISRSGADDHALQAVRGSLRENGKLIICLSDNSLLEMIDIKDHGEQEPAEFLGAILDDLLVHLEK